MAVQIKMPKSSLTMKEGTILKWYKREGDEIVKGEPLVKIMEEKSTIDLESPASGLVRKLYYEEQTDVPVGKVIAIVGSREEEIPRIKEEPSPEGPFKGDVRSVLQKKRVELVKREVKASPLAKKIAKEQGIDLTLVRGTGPGGRITEADVRDFMEEGKAAGEAEKKVKETLPVVGMRRIIGERMSHSARTYPRITLFMEVDFTGAKSFRERLKTFENVEVSYTDIIVKAVAKCLSLHPIVNSSVDGEVIKIFEDVNVGLAVATDEGLIVPVVYDADKKSLTQISKEIKLLIDKARKNTLSRGELSNGTFTITNLGMFGVDSFTPLINPPECAILGIGRIAEKPQIHGGRVVPRLISTLSLSFDHRIIDGVPAARFLKTLKSIIENVELD